MKTVRWFLILVVVVLILASCAAPTPIVQTVEVQVEVTREVEVETEVEVAVTPTPIGGELILYGCMLDREQHALFFRIEHTAVQDQFFAEGTLVSLQLLTEVPALLA